MDRPMIFRRAMDVLRISSPTSDFPGFVLNSVYAGLPSTDADLLRALYDKCRNELFIVLSTEDQSVVDATSDSISALTGLDDKSVYSILDDIRYSITVPVGSADEFPIRFSSSGLLFSTFGCMKGEVSVCGCNSQDISIVVPEHVSSGRGQYRVVSLAPNAFADMKSVRSIFLPDSIRDIGYRAFYGCSSMDDFVLPASVRRIGFRAFEGCVSLTSIAISPKNPYFKTLPGGLLCSTRVVDGVTMPFEVIRAPYTLSGSVNIPYGVTKIGSESFDGCSGITEVSVPDGLDSVMYRAFNGCSGLSRICVPDCAKIGFHAFPDAVSVETRHAEPLSDDVTEV